MSVKAKALKPRHGLSSPQKCGYLKREEALPLFSQYNEILAMIVSMIDHSDQWIIPRKSTSK
jgi:hypothetical protein